MTQPLRTLVVSTSFPLRDGATPGVFVRRMVDSLPNPIHATVLCPADAAPVQESISQARYKLLPFRYAPRPWQVVAQGPGGVMPAFKARPWRALLLPLMLGAMAWRILRDSRHTDLIHANWAICGAIATMVKPFRRRPIVVTLRGDDVTLAERSRLHRLVLDIVIRHATRIVCVASSMHVAVARLYPQSLSRVDVVLNGVGAEYLKLDPRAPCAGAPVELIAVGSLVKRKGYDLLLSALARLEGPAWRLTIIGDGPERQRLMELAGQLGIAQTIRLVGTIPPQEMPARLAQSDLIILSSRSEGRPNVVLEGMAAARPVVAFAIPGVTDLMTADEGWLAEPHDVSDFTRVLTDAIGNEQERLRRGLAARHRVIRSGWTWEATGAAYADIYRRALSSAAHGH